MPRNFISVFGSGGDYLPSAAVADPPSANRVLWLRKSVGQTTSQWDDQSGVGNNLTLFNAPTLNGDGSIGFNGTDEYGSVTLVSTLAQPSTIYMRVKITSWVDASCLIRGQGGGNTLFKMDTSSPQVTLTSGTNLGPFSGMTVGAYDSICLVNNGASSILRINGTENAGDSGTNDIGVLFMAAFASTFFHAAIDVKETIAYSVAHDGTTRNSVVTYLDTL